MSPTRKVVLASIGGYGSFYLDRILNDSTRRIALAGVVDPAWEKCDKLDILRARSITICQSMTEFFEKDRADLAIIASPHQFHADQSCEALINGCNVLCEKPISPTIQEISRMRKARDSAGKFVGVGFQWSYSTPILKLKHDITKGVFGKPQRFSGIVLWPRPISYYKRNSWAGKIIDSNNRIVLDSPLTNATAHFLHNMFFVLGNSQSKNTCLSSVEGELYRAHDIENFDTAALRCHTSDGVELSFFCSHVTKESYGPFFRFEFQDAVVSYDSSDSSINAVFSDGSVKKYGDPEIDHFCKVEAMLAAMDHQIAPPCGIEEATPHVLCCNGLQESVDSIISFPKELVHTRIDSSNAWLWVDGLDRLLMECYHEQKLPSEKRITWTKKGCSIDLTTYNEYPCMTINNSISSLTKTSISNLLL